MSLEVIDILIIIVALLLSLIFIIQKIRGLFNNQPGSHCSGCSAKSCSVEDKDSCNK